LLTAERVAVFTVVRGGGTGVRAGCGIDGLVGGFLLTDLSTNGFGATLGMICVGVGAARRSPTLVWIMRGAVGVPIVISPGKRTGCAGVPSGCGRFIARGAAKPGDGCTPGVLMTSVMTRHRHRRIIVRLTRHVGIERHSIGWHTIATALVAIVNRLTLRLARLLSLRFERWR
jgi:hypothetical protein